MPLLMPAAMLRCARAPSRPACRPASAWRLFSKPPTVICRRTGKKRWRDLAHSWTFGRLLDHSSQVWSHPRTTRPRAARSPFLDGDGPVLPGEAAGNQPDGSFSRRPDCARGARRRRDGSLDRLQLGGAQGAATAGRCSRDPFASGALSARPFRCKPNRTACRTRWE